MSKIAKAMYKAKQEWESKEGSHGASIQDEPIQGQAPDHRRTRVQQAETKHLERNRILTSYADQALLDTYNLIRTRLLHSTKDKGWNTLMITSPNPGEGKTTTAINLGCSLAREAQQTALLVDTHLRFPKVHDCLGLDCPTGLTDYLRDRAQVPDLLINPGMEHFVVLPAGPAFNGSTDLLGSPRMKELVMELKSRYPDRYVLFDCPCLLGTPDSLVFASYVDAVVLVVEAGRTKREDVAASLGLLSDRNVVGVVMNKVKSQ